MMFHLSDDQIDTIEGLSEHLGGRKVHLHLLRAIGAAGPTDRGRLQDAFPQLHLAWRVWTSFDGDYPTGRELAAALELAQRPGVKIFDPADPRCPDPECGELLREIASGYVGHCGRTCGPELAELA